MGNANSIQPRREALRMLAGEISVGAIMAACAPHSSTFIIAIAATMVFPRSDIALQKAEHAQGFFHIRVDFRQRAVLRIGKFKGAGRVRVFHAARLRASMRARSACAVCAGRWRASTGSPAIHHRRGVRAQGGEGSKTPHPDPLPREREVQRQVLSHLEGT